MSQLSNSALDGPAAVAAAPGYTRAILDLLGTRDPVSVMQDTPRQIEELIRGIPEGALVLPERPGKWSMRHVVAHLADSEIVGGWRLRLVLAHDRPPLTPYDQDVFADRLRYDDVPIGEALALFTVLRKANLRLWSGASAEELERVGLHSERGEESVGHMRKLYAGHDIAHLNQLTRIRAAVTGRAG
ncbi:MAG TPA: DinB family protein [Gemmatimonadales bacterium]|nr:DinB family protein [Gemmatimonadales bacterium]